MTNVRSSVEKKYAEKIACRKGAYPSLRHREGLSEKRWCRGAQGVSRPRTGTGVWVGVGSKAFWGVETACAKALWWEGT